MSGDLHLKALTKIRTKNGHALTEYDPSAFAETINRNGPYVQVVATGLDTNVMHTLKIGPVFAADTM